MEPAGIPPSRSAVIFMVSGLVGLCCIIVSILLVATPAAAAPAASLEYSVKANYLVRFAAFVNWPPEAFTTKNRALTICVVGSDPFGSSLNKAASGQTINGRPIAIRRIDRVDARSACNILYLASGGEQTVRDVTSALADTPVLIVTDEAHGPERGHIHFVLAQNRVRFHIDDMAAKQAGLAISSRLLSLALTVKVAS